MSAVPEISVDELAELLDGAALLDVRMPDEYEEAHVPGAVLVPLPQLPERFGDIPEGSPLYIICKAGGRSLKAAEFLAAQGAEVVNIAGGTDAWIASGRDVRTGDQPG